LFGARKGATQAVVTYFMEHLDQQLVSVPGFLE
jgi:hypothetical protein